MAKANIVCKACGETLKLSELFCPKCGYELHIYPKTVSKEVEAYEEARMEIWKKQMSKQKTQDDSLIESLKQQTKELEELVNEQSKNIETLKTEQDHALKLLDSEKAANKEMRSQLNKKSFSSDIIGIVSIKSRTSGVLQYALIHDGINTYGIDPGINSNHHEIKIRTRGNVIHDIHFSIEKNSDGQMVIKPLNGSLMCDGLYIPPSGKAVQSQHLILIDNIVEIHVSKI